MANDVFANGREISCKKADGKAIAAFPDVCMTPPTAPPTPPGVPIPYPNTAMAKDCSGGSKTVKISGAEVRLKNRSFFKTSTGDEAGSAPKKGVMTSKIKGKAYFTMWSMDVKAEAANVVRHMDSTTHNHGSVPSNTSPWPYLDGMAAPPDDHPCKEEFENEREACAPLETRRADGSLVKSSSRKAICANNDAAAKCREAQACRMAPYSEGCCPQSSGEEIYSQPHHLVEDHWVKNNPAFAWYQSGRTDASPTPAGVDPADIRTDADAPCVCATGDKWRKEHGEFHCIQGTYEQSFMPGGAREGQPFDYQAGKNGGLTAHEMVFDGRCDRACLEAQLDAFYGDDMDRPLNEPERVPPNTDSDRGWTEQEAAEYINPDSLTQSLPLPG